MHCITEKKSASLKLTEKKSSSYKVAYCYEVMSRSNFNSD